MTFSYRSALPLAALGLTVTAHDQTTQCSDRASFTSAAAGLTTFPFDSHAPHNSFTNYSSGLTVDGVAFIGSNVSLYVEDSTEGFGNRFGGHQFLDLFAGTLTVALPAGTTAFGADFSNFGVPGGSTLTALVNGVAFTFAEPGNTSAAFAGFTRSVPITRLSFSGGTVDPALDNVSFGKAGLPAVPEPSAPASFGVGVLGLVGLVVAARHRKQAHRMSSEEGAMNRAPTSSQCAGLSPVGAHLRVRPSVCVCALLAACAPSGEEGAASGAPTRFVREGRQICNNAYKRFP